MDYWLITIILAYLFFGFGAFCDKLVLAGKPNPKAYTFYVGLAGLAVFVFLPFIKFGLPDAAGFAWVVLDAIVRVTGLYVMYTAIERFDVSKVIATIGATQPIFIFILTRLFFGQQKMGVAAIVAFILLFIGSIVISIEKTPRLTGNYLKITILASLLFSLDYIFSKLVFLNEGFLQGIIWVAIFIFLFALIFIATKKSRKEIFAKRMVSNKKTQISFLGAQASGAIANFLQSFSIFLVPVAFLPIINSLRGVQYVLLFLITLFVSYFFPKILKEEISKKAIMQKIVSIIIIGSGLAVLVLY